MGKEGTTTKVATLVEWGGDAMSCAEGLGFGPLITLDVGWDATWAATMECGVASRTQLMGPGLLQCTLPGQVQG